MSSDPAKLRLKILSDTANIADVRQSVETLAGENGFDKKAADEIGLCVNEALANVIRHAYDDQRGKPIEIAAEVDSGEMHLKIRDWGSGVNPMELPPLPRDPLKPGGLGLICLKQMMDHVKFSPQKDGMLLEMSRKKSRK